MIWVILYTLIGYPILYVVYRNVFGIEFTKKKWPYVLVIGGTCLLQVLLGGTWAHPMVDTVIFCCDMVGVLILVDRKKWKAFLLFPVVYFLPAIVNMLVSYAVATVLGISHNEFRQSIALALITQLSAILVFSIYGWLFGKSKPKAIKFSLGQYLVQILGVLCFFFQIGFMQGFVEGSEFMMRYKQQFLVAILVTAILFFGLNIWQQIIWTRNVSLKQDNDNYQSFLEHQEQYVNMVIREDEKKRKMHHDMRAHIMALSALSEKGDLDEIKKYISEMEQGINGIQIDHFTNICAVDAIISEWYQRAVDNGVDWQWTGELTDIREISTYEMCIVFSNILSNAYEAVEKLTEKKYIHVKCASIRNKIFIEIMNSCETQQSGKVRPLTTKLDKGSHGYGLQNVEDVVKKYNGTIEYEGSAGCFRLSIVM